MTEVKVFPLIKEGFLQTLLPALERAKGIIWNRIQSGKWRNEGEAIAAIKIYQHIIKAIDDTEKLSQLPLPIVERGTEEVRYDQH